ncbi:MAG: universal stress protein [Gemmatimonadaceae bacterium]
MIRIQETAREALMTDPRATPFQRVVVGIDFSPASLAGCRWALTYVAPGVDVLFSHVVPFEESSGEQPDVMKEPSPVGSLRHMAPTLRGGLGGFAATLDVASARTAVRVGRPSYWLDLLAADFDASLVVVGRRQDAKRKRIGEACVVERLARRTRRPVLVVPEGVVDAPRCVIAAIDEGLSAADVLAAGTALATACRVPLIALHVLSPASGAYDRIVGGRGRTAATPVCNSPADTGGGLTLAVGDAAREIVTAGILRGGGVLVVGKRGADDSPVGSLGAVARELLATSPHTVLAIDVPRRSGGSG